MNKNYLNLEQLLSYMEIPISTLQHLISDRDFPIGKSISDEDDRKIQFREAVDQQIMDQIN